MGPPCRISGSPGRGFLDPALGPAPEIRGRWGRGGPQENAAKMSHKPIEQKPQFQGFTDMLTRQERQKSERFCMSILGNSQLAYCASGRTCVNIANEG